VRADIGKTLALVPGLGTPPALPGSPKVAPPLSRPGPGTGPPPGLEARPTLAPSLSPLAPRAALDRLRGASSDRGLPAPGVPKSAAPPPPSAPPAWGSTAAFIGVGTGHRPQLADMVGAMQQASGTPPPAKGAPVTSLQQQITSMAQAAQQALHPSSDATFAAAASAAGHAQQSLAREALGFAGHAPAATSAALSQTLDTLFKRLNNAAPGPEPTAPDALGAQIVAQTAQALFAPPSGSGAEPARQALEGLATGTQASLLQRITDALSDGTAHSDPVLDLAAVLATSPGGAQRLASLLGEAGADPQRREQLTVSVMAWHQHQQLVGDGVRADDPRRQIVLKAARHALQLAAPPGGAPADEPPQQEGEGRLAYQLLRNGLVEQGPDSAHQRANRWLDKLSTEWLQHTARRNERAAGDAFGSAINAATVLMPGSLDGKTMPLRKTSVLNATQAATQSGVLPSDKEIVAGLDTSAARWRARLSAPAAGRATDPPQVLALETMIGGLLDRLDLSVPHGFVPMPMRKLDKISAEVLADVAGTLPAEALAALGPDFAAQWQHLGKSHPNAGQVLAFLTEQLRHHEMGGPTVQTAHRPSLLARARHADALAGTARQALQGAAQAAQACASAPASPADRALAAFACELHTSLAGLPPASLHALDPTLLGSVEARMGAAPFAALPADLRAAWNTLKTGQPGIADVVHWVNLGLLPLANTSSGPVAASLHAALGQASTAVNASLRHADLDQLDDHAADLIATRGDLRTPRDLAAMMEASVRRMDLDGKFQIKDERGNGLSTNKLMKFMPFVNVVAERFMQMNRTLDINMGAHGMEIFIGQTQGTSATGGLNLRASVPGLDTALNAIPGLEAYMQVGSRHGVRTVRGEGVSLRLQDFDGDIEARRLAFGAVLSDLSQASLLVGPGKPYPDVVSALLDRHAALSLATSENHETTHTGRTEGSAMAGVDTVALAGLAANLPLPNLPDINLPHLGLPQLPSLPSLPSLPKLPRLPNLPNLPSIKLPSMGLSGLKASDVRHVGLGAALGSHSRRAQGARTETGGTLQVNDYELTARHNVDAVGRLVHLKHGMGLYSAGGSQTLRVVSSGGSVLADKTQTVQRFNNPKEFRQAIEADPEPWVALLLAKDTTPHRSETDKRAAAHHRLHDLLQDAGRSDRTRITTYARVEAEFQVIKGLTPGAAKLWDDLEASARQCENRHDEAGAQALRQSIGELLNDNRNWVAQELSFGTQSTSERILRPPLLPVVGRQALGGGQSTHMASRLTKP
jgi:hypothetical protein